MPVSPLCRHLKSLSGSFIVSPLLDCEWYLPFPVGGDGKRPHQQLVMTPGQQASPQSIPCFSIMGLVNGEDERNRLEMFRR